MPVPTVPRTQVVDNNGMATSPWLLLWQFVPTLFHGSPTTCTITWGTGSPEGVIAAPVASLYFRLDGGASTVMYVKESATDATGWVAK